ncbi:MAG: gamma-glutamyl-gamma-aminobutyrate hydrolase family protein [Pseudomonadota bacterium]
MTMRPSEPKPLIGISACLKQNDHARAHSVVDKYVDAIVDGSSAVPVIVPALSDRLEIDGLLDRLDGVFLTGSPSNVDPSYYDGPAPREDNLEDPIRDSTILPLIRRAIARGVPLLAVCRGIQELNVAFGGSLHQHIWEVPGRDDHRSDKSKPHEERYEARHELTLQPDGLLRQILNSRESIMVNSLHGQAVDRVAHGLRVEAIAPDGTIEGLSVDGAPAFALGLQWHPEWRVRENEISLAIFEAFGAACRLRRAVATEANDLSSNLRRSAVA